MLFPLSPLSFSFTTLFPGVQYIDGSIYILCYPLARPNGFGIQGPR